MTDVKHKPKGSYAVMAERRDPTDALDFFPTPPWATRALMEHVLRPCDFEGCDVHDGCAGEGHMAEVLREYFDEVHASDVRDYGVGYGVGSFLGEGADVYRLRERPDWIVMNPPFNAGIAFARKALGEARFGVALLVRNSWLESKERYKLFSVCPPSTVAVFAERVPMTKGRWDPEASTATAYVWVVWKRPLRPSRSVADLMWIEDGQRKALTRPDDVLRFDTIISRADRIECGEVWSDLDGWNTYLHTGNALLNFAADDMLKLGKRYAAHPLANDTLDRLTGNMIACAAAAREKRARGVEGVTAPGSTVAHIPHTDRTYSKGETAA